MIVEVDTSVGGVARLPTVWLSTVTYCQPHIGVLAHAYALVLWTRAGMDRDRGRDRDGRGSVVQTRRHPNKHSTLLFLLMELFVRTLSTFWHPTPSPIRPCASLCAACAFHTVMPRPCHNTSRSHAICNLPPPLPRFFGCVRGDSARRLSLPLFHKPATLARPGPASVCAHAPAPAPALGLGIWLQFVNFGTTTRTQNWNNELRDSLLQLQLRD